MSEFSVNDYVYISEEEGEDSEDYEKDNEDDNEDTLDLSSEDDRYVPSPTNQSVKVEQHEPPPRWFDYGEIKVGVYSLADIVVVRNLILVLIT